MTREMVRGTTAFWLMILVLVAGPVSAQNALQDESLRREALHAVRLGVQWLEQSQQENGCWSSPAYPAVTALAVSAILNSPDVQSADDLPESVKRGLAFILSCVQDDGGIYQRIEGQRGGGLPNYNTAICIMALVDAQKPEFEQVIARARDFLVQGQHRGDDVFAGGMGYDAQTDQPYADLSNTVFALEALRKIAPLESPDEGSRRLDWEAAIAFVPRNQGIGNIALVETVARRLQFRLTVTVMLALRFDELAKCHRQCGMPVFSAGVQ